MVVEISFYVSHHIVDDGSVYHGLNRTSLRVTSCTLSIEDSVQLTTILFDILHDVGNGSDRRATGGRWWWAVTGLRPFILHAPKR